MTAIHLAFCQNCGNEIPAGAAFCPKCGHETAVSSVGLGKQPRRDRHEKREKDEKAEKEEKGEKSGDRTGPLVGGLILIWVGISFYLVQANYVNWDLWWPYLVVGIGIILLFQAIVRYSTSRFRGAAMGSLIGGVILTAIGLAGMTGMKDWWPFVLIALGVLVLFAFG